MYLLKLQRVILEVEGVRIPLPQIMTLTLKSMTEVVLFCADLTGLEAGGSRTCVGNDLHSRRFTGTGTGTNCATESYVVQLNSPDCVFSCPAAGTVVSGTRGCGTGANIGNLVETRYTGATPGSATQNSDCTTEVVVVTASDPSCGVSGCTNSGAANYNSMATSDDGSCYIVLFSGNEGNSSTNACASTTAEILYSTVGGTTAFTDTALTSRFTGFISDGTNFRPYNNGVLDRIGTCQAPSRFTGATVTVDRETSINTTFTISFQLDRRKFTACDILESNGYRANGYQWTIRRLYFYGTIIYCYRSWSSVSVISGEIRRYRWRIRWQHFVRN